MQISYDESKKSVYSLAKSVERGEILFSSSEWKIRSDELFVAYFNENSENKIKLIKKYLFFFVSILV